MLLLEQRQSSCPAGTQFYRCSLNNFAGCCSTDPCSSAGGCPNSGRSSSSPTITSDSPSSSTPDIRIQTTSNPASSTSVSLTGSSSTILTKPTTTATELASSPSSSTSSTPIPSSLPPKSNHLLPGVITGTIIATVLILLLAFFLLRRRRRHRRMQNIDSFNGSNVTTTSSPLPPSYKSPTFSRSSKDIIAEFGGLFSTTKKSKSNAFSPTLPSYATSPSSSHSEKCAKVNTEQDTSPQMLDSTAIIAELPAVAQADATSVDHLPEGGGRPELELLPSTKYKIPERFKSESSTYSIPIRLGSPVDTVTPPLPLVPQPLREVDHRQQQQQRMLGSAVPDEALGPSLLIRREHGSEKERVASTGSHVLSWSDFSSGQSNAQRSNDESAKGTGNPGRREGS